MDRMSEKSSIVNQAVRALNPKLKKHATRSARKTVGKVMRILNRQEVPEQFYPYRSASINANKCSVRCGAVANLEGSRFLLSGVPKLPLADCTSKNCACSYDRHKDRRSFTHERRALFSMKTDLHSLGGDHERRELAGRRSQDETLFGASDTNLSLISEMT